MAAQLTATKGPPARSLASWMARAATSLPAPLSPRIITVAPLGATRAIRSRSACMAALPPRTEGAPESLRTSWRRTRFSRRSEAPSRARATASFTSSVFQGFLM